MLMTRIWILIRNLILRNQYLTPATAGIRSAVQEQSLQLIDKLNRVRLISTICWLVVSFIGTFSDDPEPWRLCLLPISIYVGLSWTIRSLALRNRLFLKWSRYSPIVVDIWMIFYIQMIPIDYVVKHMLIGHQAFTLSTILAVFCVTIVFSLLTLSPRITFLCLLIGSPLLGYSMILLGLYQWDLIMGSILVMTVMSFGANAVVSQIMNLIGAVLNETTAKIRLSKYFSPEVANLISSSSNSELKGTACHLSIVFVDIRGFTQLSSQLASAKVIELLNRFYATASSVIDRNHGILDKFMGDGFLAYFGYPNQSSNHAELAIHFAIELQSQMLTLNAELAMEKLPPVKIGIGINTGDVIAGNIGTLERKDFTIIGDSVNTACRIQELTKKLEAPILVSQQTHELTAQKFEFQKFELVEIRGKSGSFNLYCPALQLDRSTSRAA